MTKETGGPAFPTEIYEGMTMRDYFAAKAMQAMVNEYDDFNYMAGLSYEIADAMLEARTK